MTVNAPKKGPNWQWAFSLRARVAPGGRVELRIERPDTRSRVIFQGQGQLDVPLRLVDAMEAELVRIEKENDEG